MTKKVYTKEQRYIMRMEEQGYSRKNFWVHKDDYNKVQKYITNLRAKRTTKVI